MKDVFGNTLNIGDTVVFHEGGYYPTTLRKGEVIRIDNFTLRIQAEIVYPNIGKLKAKHEFNKYPDSCVKYVGQ